MKVEELLTLADRMEYYASPELWTQRERVLPPEKLTKASDKAHDNIKRLLRENDILLANQFALRKTMKRIVYWAGIAILAAWTPLWLPLLKQLAGLP